MKYSEETLKNWKNPASDTEEQKISNTVSMIKSAVANCPGLDDLTNADRWIHQCNLPVQRQNAHHLQLQRGW